MATFYQDAIKQIGSTEAVLHSLYKKIGRKDHVEFTEELLENRGGKKKDLDPFLLELSPIARLTAVANRWMFGGRCIKVRGEMCYQGPSCLFHILDSFSVP